MAIVVPAFTLGAFIGGLVLWLVLDRRNQRLKQALAVSEQLLSERDQQLQQQAQWAEQNRALLRAEFEALSHAFLKHREQELRASNQDQLGSMLKPLAERIESFQSRVNQVHSDMVSQGATLGEQIRGLEKLGLAMTDEAHTLSQALKGDKKLLGNWGETQLERTLELAGLRKGEHFETQVTLKDDSGKRFMPDFVVRLPEGKSIVLDSKVSLVDYQSAVAAESDAERTAALARHVQAVKNHIDDLSAKAYAQFSALTAPDFVLMFMPVEPAYLEIMKHHRELYSYGYNRGVILVSHTTVMPILRTVGNLWMVERGNKEARAISDMAGDIYNAVCLVAERLSGVGASLQTMTRKYNDTVTSLAGQQGLHGKVSRFKDLSHKASRAFPEDLTEITDETQDSALAAVREASQPENTDGS